MGIAKLKKLDNWNRTRKENNDYLISKLKGIKGIKFFSIPEYIVRGYYGTPAIYLQEQMEGVSKEKFMTALNFEGVAIETKYKTIIERGIYEETCNFWRKESCSI